MADANKLIKLQEAQSSSPNLRGSPTNRKGGADQMSHQFEQLKSVANQNGILKTTGWQEVEEQHEKATAIIAGLDTSLNQVLRKQEYEYLQAYNIYVKRKEKELKNLIQALSDKNSNNNIKESRISTLEVTVDQLRQKASEDERAMEQLKKETKMLKEKIKVETEEKEFYHKQALDAKRKNKLLKVAIGRLQLEKQKPDENATFPAIAGDNQKERDTTTFLTKTNIDEENAVDNIANSQALVEQNIMASNMNKKKPKSQTQHKRT